MTFDDFRGWLLGKTAAYGVTEQHLLKISHISIVRHFEAADRWARLESEPSRSAPFWLNEQEARFVANALKAQRGATSRLLRQQIQDMFE